VSEDNPFAPPPEAGYAPPHVPTGQPLPAWAPRPATVPPRPLLDTWAVAGWQAKGTTAPRAWASVLALMLVVLPFLFGAWAEAVSFRRDEDRRYVLAEGVVAETDEGRLPVLEVWSPETGNVYVVVTDGEEVFPGEPVEVMVARDDPADYFFTYDRTWPWVHLAILGVGVAIAAAAGTALLLVRRRDLDLAAVESVARPLDAQGAPPPLPGGPAIRPRWTRWRCYGRASGSTRTCRS